MGLRRGVSPGMMAALQGVLHPVTLVWLDWPEEPVFAHSNAGVISWDGHDWRGVGIYGRLDVPEEMAGMISSRATLSLLGVPPAVFETVDAQVRNRAGRIWFGAATTPGGNTLAGAPCATYAGYVDAMRYTIQREGEDLVHAIQVELGSGPSARASSSVWHSWEDQAAKHPGDTAGRFLVNVEAEAEALTWPE